jgi:DNA repair photolyase
MLFGDSPRPDLTGIARLAAESDLLESKRRVRYFEIETRSALNRVRSGMPFTYGLNPYRGCEFGCRYCYARYTHEFMELHESDEFENQIYAKRNVAVLLARELNRVKPGEAIAIGTATDPYQPAERRFRRTREALEVIAQRSGVSVSITTKSDLVRRDVDLLRAIGERNELTVNMTITTLDAALARELEPRAPRPDLRLAPFANSAQPASKWAFFPTRSCR